MSRSISLALALALLPFLRGVADLRAEEAPQAADLFPTLDANSDGVLSADEIGESQRSAFERLLRVGDADSDGRLTREEYLKAFEPEPAAGGNLPSRADAPARTQRPGGPDRPDFRRLFEMADRDGDGKVALSDLPEPVQQRMRPLYERLGKEELTREDFERMGRLVQSNPAGRGGDGRLFERFDADGNGRLARDEVPQLLRRRFDPVFERLGKEELTRAEFQQAVRPPADAQAQPGADRPTTPTDRAQSLLVLVRVLDADGDGELTMAEIERLNTKFAELDADGDGKLSRDELSGLVGRPMPRDGEETDRPPAEGSPRPRRPDAGERGSD